MNAWLQTMASTPERVCRGKRKKKKQGREKHSVMSKAQECGPSNV